MHRHYFSLFPQHAARQSGTLKRFRTGENGEGSSFLQIVHTFRRRTGMQKENPLSCRYCPTGKSGQ